MPKTEPAKLVNTNGFGFSRKGNRCCANKPLAKRKMGIVPNRHNENLFNEASIGRVYIRIPMFTTPNRNDDMSISMSTLPHTRL